MNERMKICIEHGPWLRRYGLEGSFRQLKTAGFDAIDYSELCNTETPLWKLSEEEFKAELEKVKDFAAKYGIEVFQTHCPWRFPPQDYTEEQRAERLEKFTKAVRGTAYLGCKIMIVHCIMPWGAQACEDKDEFIRLNAEFFGSLAVTAKECGVEIHVETLPFPKLPINSTQQCLDFARLMNEKTGTDLFRVCIDTGHCNFCSEDPADAVRLVGGEMLGSLHVHDNKGKNDEHLAPFLGTIDWEDFSKALQETRFDGVLSLECLPNAKLPNDILEDMYSIYYRIAKAVPESYKQKNTF